ncbi:MAG: DNRLRE domain-containing protein [Ardenticatenia bacterium]|nr:DNRLRE domain-containing protein [Ardenticatenia bacterium]
MLVLLPALLVVPGFLALLGRGQTATAAPAVVNVTIYASADTYVDNGDPTQNFGNSTTIDVGACWEFTTAQIGLISFNLSTIPSGAVIHSAELRLYKVPGGSTLAATVQVHRVTASWNEYSVTWNTRPTYDATPVASTSVAAPAT